MTYYLCILPSFGCFFLLLGLECSSCSRYLRVHVVMLVIFHPPFICEACLRVHVAMILVHYISPPSFGRGEGRLYTCSHVHMFTRTRVHYTRELLVATSHPLGGWEISPNCPKGRERSELITSLPPFGREGEMSVSCTRVHRVHVHACITRVCTRA